MNPAERSAALEGLRGYAACLVFLVHAFGLLAVRFFGPDFDRPIAEESDPLRGVLTFFHRSHYGVDLFFVLSGLLMGDLALRRWRGTKRFLWRRWLRIYPTYALSTVILALVVAGWLHQTPSARDAVANALLLHGFLLLDVRPINPTSWSLSYEAVFYALVPLLAWRMAGRSMALRRAALPLVTLFAVLVVVPALLPIRDAIYLAYFALFVPGIALGLLDETERSRVAAAVPGWAVAFAWIAFTLAWKLEWLSNGHPTYYVASAVGCGLLVLKACDREGALARWLSARAPLWLGRHSYSFFLIHYLVVHAWGAAALKLVGADERIAYAAIFMLGAFPLSLAAAWALFLATERFYFRAAR